MPAETPHAAFRREVRTKALTVATDQLGEVGWDHVRISDIASTVGVSRPTIYAEFGNKDGLAEILVMEETTRFLVGVTSILDANTDDPIIAVEKAISYTLDEADKSPILRAILTSGTSGNNGSNSLLPFITTRGAPVMLAANEALFDWFAAQAPNTSKQQIADAVDSLVRLVVSHMMVPKRRQRRTPAKFGRLAALLLPELTE